MQLYNKNEFFTSLLFMTIDNNCYYATKFIVEHKFSITTTSHYNSQFIYVNNQANKKFKINKINRQIISKFEINSEFLYYYKFGIENMMQRLCYCEFSKILNYIWKKLSPQQILEYQNIYLNHTLDNLNSYYSNNILKIFKNSNNCSCCNYNISKNELYKKIIILYKKIIGKKENDIVYIFNYINCYHYEKDIFKWEYFRILYFNGFNHKYDSYSPLEIIKYLKNFKTKFKENKHDKFDSNLDCILKIIDFQLCVQYLRQKYLNKYNKNVTIFRQSLQDINNEFKYAPVCNKLSISSMIGLEFKKYGQYMS